MEEERRPEMMHKLFQALFPFQAQSTMDNNYVMIGKLLDGPINAHRKFVLELGKDKDKIAVGDVVKECRRWMGK